MLFSAFSNVLAAGCRLFSRAVSRGLIRSRSSGGRFGEQFSSNERTVMLAGRRASDKMICQSLPVAVPSVNLLIKLNVCSVLSCFLDW